MIRGNKQYLSQTITPLKAGIHNRFDVEVVDSKTGKVKQRATGYNTICNNLWSCLEKETAYFKYIHYGTGSGTPSSGDSSLFSFHSYGTVSIGSVKLSPKDCVASVQGFIQLSETTAVGITLTEVGIASGTGSSTLCTHAMLKDMNGNPISIEKTDTDIINIYATVYLHWSSEYSDPNGDIQWLAPSYYTTKTIYHWALGISTNKSAHAMLSPNRYSRGISFNSGPLVYASPVTGSFDASTRKLTLTVSRFSSGYSNIAAGAHGVFLFSYMRSGYAESVYNAFLYLKSGGSWYPGTDVVGESVGSGDGETTDFATKFDLPEDATVYVDGVEASNVVVDRAPIKNTLMHRYFNYIDIKDGIVYPSAPYDNANQSGNSYPDQIEGGLYENPFWEFGIKKIVPSSGGGDNYTYKVSDDGVNWSSFNTSSGIVPEEHRYKRYWNIPSAYFGTTEADTLTGKNIHFPEPPSTGSVITVDYHTPVITKDSNHVFDLTVTIQLGEYTEAQ